MPSRGISLGSQDTQLPNDPIEAAGLAAELRRSDWAYFVAAAECQPIAGGTVHWLAGLQHLAAGCIVVPNFADTSLEIFLSEASEFLTSIGSPLFRFYTASLDARLEKALVKAGFASSAELAVVRTAKRMSGPIIPQELRIRPVTSESDWQVKARLAGRTTEFPDGKSADHLEWTELERRKAESGYGSFWIVEQEGFACGTFGLSRWGTILRLKNLAVDPASQRSGIASAAIDFASAHAAERGLEWLGAFALAGGKGEGLYRNCKFAFVGAQTEWSRVVAPIPAILSRPAAASAC